MTCILVIAGKVITLALVGRFSKRGYSHVYREGWLDLICHRHSRERIDVEMRELEHLDNL